MFASSVAMHNNTVIVGSHFMQDAAIVGRDSMQKTLNGGSHFMQENTTEDSDSMQDSDAGSDFTQ